MPAARRDESLQGSHVHLPQHQASDERVELLQVQTIVLDAPLVGVLRQVLRRRSSERAMGSESVQPSFTDLIDPPRELLERLAEVTRSSAFANSRSSDLLVDMPDPTTPDET